MNSGNQKDRNNREQFSDKDIERNKLVLYNDQVNSIDFVISSLVDICNYEDLRAEQLTLIAHYTGKSIIKTGDRIYLAALKQQFDEVGLHVEIH